MLLVGTGCPLLSRSGGLSHRRRRSLPGRSSLVFDGGVITGNHPPEGLDGSGVYLQVFQYLNEDITHLGA